MRLYRIEHAMTHEGPYKHLGTRNEHTEITDQMVRHHNNDRVEHPTPWNDGIKESFYYDGKCNCAFRAIEDLEEWFDPYLAELSRLGFVIAEIQVDERYTRSGKKQTVYMPHYATSTTYPIPEELYA